MDYHIVPLTYLYRLDETATFLCPEYNSKKSDHFLVDFYTEKELLVLGAGFSSAFDFTTTKIIANRAKKLFKSDGSINIDSVVEK